MSETTATEAPRLTEVQLKIRLRLMQGETLDRIAAIVQLTQDEVHQAIADPLFLASINAVREAHWQHLICRVQALAIQAVEILAGAMQDKDAPARTRAARLLLDYQLKLQKLQAAPAKRNIAESSVRQVANPPVRNGGLIMPGVR